MLRGRSNRRLGAWMTWLVVAGISASCTSTKSGHDGCRVFVRSPCEDPTLEVRDHEGQKVAYFGWSHIVPSDHAESRPNLLPPMARQASLTLRSTYRDAPPVSATVQFEGRHYADLVEGWNYVAIEPGVIRLWWTSGASSGWAVLRIDAAGKLALHTEPARQEAP